MHLIVKNKEGNTPSRYIPLIRIALKIHNASLQAANVRRVRGEQPTGEVSPYNDVPIGIIGHWLEITNKYEQVIYRRYIQNSLPLNLENAGVKLQRIYSLEQYCIHVPELSDAHQLTLFEQSRANPQCPPERKVRLQLSLSQPEHLVNLR